MGWCGEGELEGSAVLGIGRWGGEIESFRVEGVGEEVF
jgi:hypothetical protein